MLPVKTEGSIKQCLFSWGCLDFSSPPLFLSRRYSDLRHEISRNEWKTTTRNYENLMATADLCHEGRANREPGYEKEKDDKQGSRQSKTRKEKD